MKAMWTGEYVEYHGKYVDFPKSVCLPRPVQRPHPPVLLGSIGSPRVFKRVVEWGDGWLPFSADPQEIATGKAELEKIAGEKGRDMATIDITVFAPGGLFRTKAELADLAKAGADNAVIWLQGESEYRLVDAAHQPAEALVKRSLKHITAQ